MRPAAHCPSGLSGDPVAAVVSGAHPHAPSQRRHLRRGVGVLALSLALGAGTVSAAHAATVGLGTADSFGVLGGSAVTNTGPTTIDGDLGVSPGTALSGFPPGTIGGALHLNDAVAGQAQLASLTAYNDAAGRPSTETVSGDLAGRTLVAGVYTSATSLGLTGDLTLDAQGDPNAVFVFQAGSTLTTSAGSRVRLVNGAQACNVFWQVGSSATIGTGSAFTGTILARTSISFTTGATLAGRALAQNGAVTLDTNVVTRATCAIPDTGSAGGGTTAPTPTSPGTTSPGTTGTTGGTATSGTTAATPQGGTTTRAPRLVTGLAATPGPTTARLGSRVQPGTSTATYGYQYGTTTRYGRSTTPRRVPGGSPAFSLRSEVGGLRPDTTYHYRVYSVGPGGRRTLGRDRTFRTPARTADATPGRLPRRTGGFTG
jgi:hypothetical protein